MSQQAIDVRVLAPQDAHCAQDLPFWAPIDVALYRTIGPAKFGMNPFLGRKVEAMAPDLLHLHGLWTYQSVVTQASRRPLVISPRGMLDPWAIQNARTKKRIALRLAEAKNLHGAMCIHALNSDEAQAIRNFGITSPIAVIPNGVDLPETKAPVPPSWLRGDGRKVLLFLGRLHPKKGLVELLRSWALLRDMAPVVARSWRLVIAGWDDGGHLDILKRTAGELNIKDDVMFPGAIYHDAKHSLLSHSDAFILPSYSEGLPVSVLEAWAYGLPVFMTPQCNLSFAFAQSGAVAVTTVPAEIAKKLATSLGTVRSAEVGMNGRTIAAELYGWKRIAAKQIEMYEWLLGERGRPDFVTLD